MSYLAVIRPENQNTVYWVLIEKEKGECSMTKDEALALFERVYAQLVPVPHERTIQLGCRLIGSLLYRRQEWSILIGEWVFNGTPVEPEWQTAHLRNEQDWRDYKRSHAILETDEDLDSYADAMRAQAESELEQGDISPA